MEGPPVARPDTNDPLTRRAGDRTGIPERSDQITRRKAKGSIGGRPPTFDAEIYKDRNTVERGFGRLKQWRAIATRYDKICHHLARRRATGGQRSSFTRQ